MEDFKRKIRSIPGFPKQGIVFRDITTLLKEGDSFRKTAEAIAGRYPGAGFHSVACIEARGFLLGGAVAYLLGAGLVPIRKKGKLPAEVYTESYELEYGTDTLEIHRDAFGPGDRVLLLDDLLATGGTAAASVRLIEKTGAEVGGIAFLIELADLQGVEKLSGYPVFSLMRF